MPDTTPPFARLKADFREFMDDLEWPQQQAFIARCREKQLGSAAKVYAKIRRGIDVPWDYAQILVEAARVRPGWSGEFTDALEEIDVSEALDKNLGWDSWASAEGALRSVERRDGKELPEMLCSAAMVSEAVRTIMKCVARKTALPGVVIPDDAQVAAAESMMQRTLTDFTKWFLAMHAKEPRVLMFPVCRRSPRKKWEPVSVSSVIPLSQQAGDALIAGEKADLDLTPDDIQIPASYILIHAMGEYADHKGFTYDKVTSAQVHCVFVQFGHATFPETEQYSHPTLIAFGGNRHYDKRLKRLTFRPTGTTLSKTHIPLFTYRSPFEWITKPDDHALADYYRVRSAIKTCRDANAELWSSEALS